MWNTSVINNCVYWLVYVILVVNVWTVEGCEEFSGVCLVNETNYFLDCSGQNLVLFEVKDKEQCFNFSVDLSNNGLSDFTSFREYLREFRDINLSLNQISNFEAESDMKVENLNISHNNAISATFNILRELRHLDASYNKLTNIKCLKKIEVLIVSHNTDTLELDPECFSESLEYLDLSHSSFKRIPNLQNTALKTIILSNTSIEDTSVFSNIEPLEFLDISFNKISDISNLNLTPKIRYLNLSYNRIVKIKTFIEHLTPALENTTRTIDFRYNTIDKADLNVVASRVTNISKSDDCSCANFSSDSNILLFCATTEQCLLDEISPATTEPAAVQPVKIIENDNVTNNSSENDDQETTSVDSSAVPNQTAEVNITSPLSHASYFFMSLGAAKLSFLGFLFVTLIVLIVINYIVGDPVVDDRWWEEKQPGDRPVT